MTRFRVLIVTYARWEGLSRLPELLHQAGCEISVLGVQGNYPSLSVYIRKMYLSPDDANAVVSDLNIHLQERPEKYDWVVIADDALLLALTKRRDEAWVQQHFPGIADQRMADFVSSKAVFYDECRQRGISVPDFEVCTTQAELINAANRLGFPLLLKDIPGITGQAARVIPDALALEAFTIRSGLIVQKLIQGRVGSVAAVYRYGKPISWFSYYRTRSTGAFGPSAAIQYQVFSGLDEALRLLGQISGFHGLCGVDFVEEAGTGKLFLLEQNFRPTLTACLGRRVGVDMARAIPAMFDIDYLSHYPFPQQAENNHKIVPLFPQDVLRAIDAGDYVGLLKWLCYPLWWRELRLHEPVIFLHNLRQIFQKFKEFRRRRQQSSHVASPR